MPEGKVSSSPSQEIGAVSKYSEPSSQLTVPQTPVKQGSHISKLPGELLLTILDLVILSPQAVRQTFCPEWGPPLDPCRCELVRDRAAAKTLALVCRSFYSIVLPKLHYKLCFPIWPKKDSKTAFRRLQGNAQAWRHASVLSITVDKLKRTAPMPAEIFGLATEVVSQLSKVQCLEVYGNAIGFTAGEGLLTWTFVRESLLRLPLITHLSIGFYYHGLHVRDIWKLNEFTSLRRLVVYGVSRRVFEEDEEILCKVRFPKKLPLFSALSTLFISLRLPCGSPH